MPSAKQSSRPSKLVLLLFVSLDLLQRSEGLLGGDPVDQLVLGEPAVAQLLLEAQVVAIMPSDLVPDGQAPPEAVLALDGLELGDVSVLHPVVWYSLPELVL